MTGESVNEGINKDMAAVIVNEGINQDTVSSLHKPNIVDSLCKIGFLDVIINSKNYFYFPSYFQGLSIKLPWEFKINTIEWLYPKDTQVDPVGWWYLYDNIYTTMPMLSDDLASLIAIREELLWSEIIPDLRSELRPGFEEWKNINVLIESYGTYRSQDPRYGALYDVFTEYLGPYNRKRILLKNLINEYNSLHELLEHNGNLLEEAGLLNDSESNSSESNSSNES